MIFPPAKYPETTMRQYTKCKVLNPDREYEKKNIANMLITIFFTRMSFNIYKIPLYKLNNAGHIITIFLYLNKIII